MTIENGTKYDLVDEVSTAFRSLRLGNLASDIRQRSSEVEDLSWIMYGHLFEAFHDHWVRCLYENRLR